MLKLFIPNKIKKNYFIISFLFQSNEHVKILQKMMEMPQVHTHHQNCTAKWNNEQEAAQNNSSLRIRVLQIQPLL